MSTLSYPTTLPGPEQSSVTPAERRLLSDLSGGPQQARGVQRDYLGTQRLEWFLTAGDAAAFDDWWRNRLSFGGAWFAASWPAPQGFMGLVRRFIGAPSWSHVAGGFWRVSAQVQVRGRGALPQLKWRVDLDGILNASNTSAVGKSISGLDPAAVYSLQLESGRLYTAWKAISSIPQFLNRVMVTTTAGSYQINAGVDYPDAASAFAGFPASTLTGFSTYTFWLNDFPNVSDNAGGLSLLIQ